MADRKIKLTWASSRYVLGTDDGYRVRITAECAENTDSKIFAYRMRPLDPQTGEEVGFFSHVASPVDLEEFPASAPRAGEIPKWFRLNFVDVFLRSTKEAEDFITDVRGDVSRLRDSLNRLDVITPTGADAIGGPLECFSSSSSLSSSSSASAESLSSEPGGPLLVLRATGTFEQNVGHGLPWMQIGTGAGSPVQGSDSLSGMVGYNRSRVLLQCDQVSKELLIQGFDFDLLPDDAVIEGLLARLYIREVNELGSSSSSASSSGEEDDGPRLFYFKLYKPDVGPTGDDKSDNNLIIGNAWQTLTFGGAADLWDAGITVADLRRGDFGVSIITALGSEIALATVEIDGVELEIFYRE